MKTTIIVQAGTLGVLLISGACVTAGPGRLESTAFRPATPANETVEVEGTLAELGGSAMDRLSDGFDCAPDVLAVVMTVPAAQRHRVQEEQWVELTTAAVPGVSFLGKVKYISPGADPETRWVRVVAHVSNDEGQLDVGLPVQGFIRVSTHAVRP
jgi:multidrug efflux pump subunit AcrA (membrane-fusion protein)